MGPPEGSEEKDPRRVLRNMDLNRRPAAGSRFDLRRQQSDHQNGLHGLYAAKPWNGNDSIEDLHTRPKLERSSSWWGMDLWRRIGDLGRGMSAVQALADAELLLRALCLALLAEDLTQFVMKRRTIGSQSDSLLELRLRVGKFVGGEIDLAQ